MTKFFCFAVVLFASTTPAAIAEDIEVQEGYPEYLLYMLEVDATGGGNEMAENQAIADELRWQPGQTLRVCFFGGNPVVHQLIAKTAAEWSNYANIKFEFSPNGSTAMYDCTNTSGGFSQIRIGFGEPGYWSLMGTQSVQMTGQLQPSMNFQRFDVEFNAFSGFTVQNVAQNASVQRRGTILHEFGHALGLFHEHQNKNLNCWAEVIQSGADSVYTYFGGSPNFWSEEKVRINLGVVSNLHMVSGQPDPVSIMMYLFPERVLIGGRTNKCFISARSTKISEKDKAWIAAAYPAGQDFPMDEPVSDGGAIDDTFSQKVFSEAVSPRLQTDMISRALVDIASADTSTRRFARTQLSDILSLPGGTESLDAILATLGDNNAENYRVQLGIAVAVGKAAGLAPSEDAKAALSGWQSRTQDATLKTAISGALKARN